MTKLALSVSRGNNPPTMNDPGASALQPNPHAHHEEIKETIESIVIALILAFVFRAFVVRTYRSLVRHWLCSRMVMYFLAAQTQRLWGGKSTHHAGTSGRGGQYPGVEDLEPLAALVG